MNKGLRRGQLRSRESPDPPPPLNHRPDEVRLPAADGGGQTPTPLPLCALPPRPLRSGGPQRPQRASGARPGDHRGQRGEDTDQPGRPRQGGESPAGTTRRPPHQEGSAIIETYANLDHEALRKLVYERCPGEAKQSRRRNIGKRSEQPATYGNRCCTSPSLRFPPGAAAPTVALVPAWCPLPPSSCTVALLRRVLVLTGGSSSGDRVGEWQTALLVLSAPWPPGGSVRVPDPVSVP